MAINVEVSKNQNESTANLIRRFSKRMQGAGIIPKVRGRRYFSREKSRNVEKTSRLRKLEGKITYEKLLKLGKIKTPQPRRR